MTITSRLCNILAAAVICFIAVMPHARAQEDDPYLTQCAMKDWGGILSPGKQTLEKIEVISHPLGEILAYKLSPLIGAYAKLYVFLLDDGTCFRKVFSIGSYAATNALASGEGRIYHADLYEEGSHSTIDFFNDEPSYEDARKLAEAALK